MMRGGYSTMATSDDKPKKSERMRRWIDFIFGFENKKGDVLDYQIHHADGLNLSPQEFYANVEQQLAARKFPSLEISRQEFSEGGLLANQRTYLRLMRERLAITTCAAPFGNVFFFSFRTVYVPALVRLWHILAALIFLGVVGYLLLPPLGMSFTVVAVIALVFAIAAVLQNASAVGPSNLDARLLNIPVVATIYEDWFRVETYYREDTRNLYLTLLPQLIHELAAEACAAKGVKLDPQSQRNPKVADLDQPRRPDPKPPGI